MRAIQELIMFKSTPMNILRILSLLMFFLTLLSHAEARTCTIKGSVCAEGPGTKVISGVSIYRACWRYRDTYECVDDPGYDYCNAISRVAGCNKTSESLSGGVTTRIYTCGANTVAPGGVTQLADSYTVKTDSQDHAQCASYDSNASCKLANHVCIEGPATRSIDGASVYRDCWKWRDDYTCQTANPRDYCSPLISAGCTRTKSICKATSPIDNSCIEYTDTYQCGEKQEPPPANVVHLDSSYTITDDSLLDQCVEEETDPYCVLANETCVESAATRNINGLDVYKDCWKWEREYTCTQDTPVSDCAELENNPSCEEIDGQCIDELSDGRCSVFVHEYKCMTSESVTQTVQNCQTQRFCFEGRCFDTGYPPDGDFAKVIAMMEAMNEFSYGLFKGEAHSCASKRAWNNCCKENNGLAGSSNASLLSTSVMFGAETIRALGAPYVYNAIFNSGITALESIAAQEIFSTATIGQIEAGTGPAAGSSFLPSFLQPQVISTWGEGASDLMSGGWMSGNPTFSFYGIQFSFGYTATTGWSAALSFNPAALILQIAIQAIISMASCDEEDMMTGAMKRQGLCHKIGSWCDEKVLGSCITRKEGYCCYPSKLARILQEQGRTQLGKAWGSPKNPDCSGFTPGEFSLINFDNIDFSEFIGDLIKNLPTNKGPGYAQERAAQNIQNTINSLGSYYDQ
jgi:conjugal transfer mating pair stabilization protein TraN